MEQKRTGALAPVLEGIIAFFAKMHPKSELFGKFCSTIRDCKSLYAAHVRKCLSANGWAVFSYVRRGPTPGMRKTSQAKGRDNRKKTSANSGTDSTGVKASSPTPNQRRTRTQSWWNR